MNKSKEAEDRIETLQSEVEERKRLWVEAMDEAQTQKDRAAAAEARAAELEDELRRRQEIIDDARIRMDKLDLADRLAEAAKPAIKQLFSYDHAPGVRVAVPLKEALAAYHSAKAVVNDPHPDTERLDWLLRVYRLDREAIDAAREGSRED